MDVGKEAIQSRYNGAYELGTHKDGEWALSFVPSIVGVNMLRNWHQYVQVF